MVQNLAQTFRTKTIYEKYVFWQLNVKTYFGKNCDRLNKIEMKGCSKNLSFGVDKINTHTLLSGL